MDRKELEKIYNEAYRAVYWTAFSLLKNEDDAQDIVQDTFVALINSYDSIQDKSKIVPWLKKVAANKSLNRLTRTKTDNVEDEFFDTVETVPEDFLPDSLVESEETRKIIMDIINNSLSEEIRMTLILFYFDEMSTKEVAEALGIPEGTVSRRIHSAKKKIKKEVEKYEEENDTKLFMVVPFLTQLFEKEAEQVPFRPIPASLLNLSASTGAAEAAGSEIASQALKKGTEVMLKKIIITSVSVVLVGAATAGIIYFATRKNEKNDVKKRAGKNEENEITAIDPDTEDTGSNGEDPSGAKSTSDAAGAEGSTGASTEESTAATTETATEDTTAAPTETEERNEADYVFDLTDMSAEEIADLCDSLTTRKIPQVGDTVEDVRKTYYDVEPWNYTQEFCGRYSKSDKDNVNCIYVSGVHGDGSEENGGPIVNKVTDFGTGLVLEIYDYDKAMEFIRIMKERHPVLEEKPNGSWKSDDFVVGMTAIDYITYKNGIHFQIAYGEKSIWYESVAGVFGFGYNITTGDPTEETAADSN
ncbi:MAG: sigma-70 family RNA polymerase sigma factor [Saccharofermentanaceae bacterium]|nr:sigma-70 family RNA polymerase sigma factor [Saccharofermentanaceae bacterium]